MREPGGKSRDGRIIVKLGNKSQQAHAEWTTRFKEAQAQFSRFDVRWKKVVGEDYDRIVSMRDIRR